MGGWGWVGVWVGVGLVEIKANSAKFQVKLPTGAELGNISFRDPIKDFQIHLLGHLLKLYTPQISSLFPN